MRTASAAAFRTPAAVFPVAPSVEAAQAHQLPEAERNIVVQKQNAVFRARKRPGDPQEKAAEHPVHTLRQPAAQTGEKTVMHGLRLVEHEGQAKVLHRDPLRRTAGPAQPPVKSFQHFPVLKAERRFHAQPGGLREHTGQKNCQPPVPLGNFHAGPVFQAQLQRTGQHLVPLCRLKMCRSVFRL